jgi:NAD(P)-dependent dehydrogenase (short-subunit alcohol dehydrogenase family)
VSASRPAPGRRAAIVTGVGMGIGGGGRAIAARLAADGLSVMMADADPRVVEVAADIAESLDSAETLRTYTGDLSVEANVKAMVDATIAAFGRIDVLVNNAGIFRAAEFLDIGEADWDAVIGVNLKGAFLVGQAVARAMAASGGGAIVNMSSVNGVMAIPTIASYNASKGGINQLTRAMALSLADRGIRVNAVAPGTIATDLAQKAVLGSAEARERIMSRTPLRRLGDPAEIASVCAFLASDAASYMTGEVVYVDGGRLALNYTMPPKPPAA